MRSNTNQEPKRKKDERVDGLVYKERRKMNQKIVSTVSFLLGGDFSIICFCKSMNVEPLFANSLRRLITESSLKLATARSACTRSYLHVRPRISTSVYAVIFNCKISIFMGVRLHTQGGRRSNLQPSSYSCEQQ